MGGALSAHPVCTVHTPGLHAPVHPQAALHLPAGRVHECMQLNHIKDVRTAPELYSEGHAAEFAACLSQPFESPETERGVSLRTVAQVAQVSDRCVQAGILYTA